MKLARSRATQLLSTYGMVVVLLLLCGYFSIATFETQHPSGAAAGEQAAASILSQFGDDAQVLIVARKQVDERAFADAAERALTAGGATVVKVIGEPRDARPALAVAANGARPLDAIAATQAASQWGVIADRSRLFPKLATAKLFTPQSYRWPTFLKRDNLLNIANQIAVIAIVAIGMTIVIITGGIDLSVGSLIALSAVLAAILIRDFGGGVNARPVTLVLASAVAIGACGVVGLVSGSLITYLNIKPFIVTLAMLMVARGLALRLSGGLSIYQVPASFTWLGRGADVFGIPNAVLLTIVLYAAAQVLMSRTVLGRHIYAVGGNAKAAWLSGIRNHRVILFAYVCSGMLAGLGGIVLASQLQSGNAIYGQSYELYVIAAVVVGGTSLAGGEGRIFGTLVGALIIAVIQNGMNMTGIESFTQMIVFGLVILGAVLLDTLRQRWT